MDFNKTFIYLEQFPLIWLFLTFSCYLFADYCFNKFNRIPFLNPVAISSLIIIVVLVSLEVNYQTYFQGAQFIHFLLGPTIICFAIPIQTNFNSLMKALLPILFSLIIGGLTAAISAILLAKLLNIDIPTILSIVPKSVTAPVAMGIAESIGGISSLAAVAAVLTGISGAILVSTTFNILGIKDWRARGFAVGVCAHGIGTSRAFQVNNLAGTYATIGMGANALFSSIVLPYLVWIVL